MSKDLINVNQGRGSRISRVSSGSDLMSNDDIQSIEMKESDQRSRFN